MNKYTIKFVIADKIFEYGEYLSRNLAEDVLFMLQQKHKRISFRISES